MDSGLDAQIHERFRLIKARPLWARHRPSYHDAHRPEADLHAMLTSDFKDALMYFHATQQ